MAAWRSHFPSGHCHAGLVVCADWSIVARDDSPALGLASTSREQQSSCPVGRRTRLDAGRGATALWHVAVRPQCENVEVTSLEVSDLRRLLLTLSECNRRCEGEDRTETGARHREDPEMFSASSRLKQAVPRHPIPGGPLLCATNSTWEPLAFVSSVSAQANFSGESKLARQSR